MKEAGKTYVGAAVFFERPADDGWLEDASASVQLSDQRVQGANRLSLSQWMKSLFRTGRNKTRLPDAGE
jgi:hypothetical protein